MSEVLSQDKGLSDALKSWMLDRWGVPLYSEYAWFQIGDQRYRHVALAYRTLGDDSQARVKVASALKAALEKLPARGLLVLRDGPWVSSDDDWEWDGRFYQSKGRYSMAYVRLSFVGGATEDELKALDACKPETQYAALLP